MSACRIRERFSTILVVSLLLLVGFIGMIGFDSEVLSEICPISGGNKTLYVGGSGGGNYSKIQDAIDNASSGDTVFVYNGSYQENILINKTLNLIGEGRNNTIIDGKREYITIKIESDYVNVSGFKVINTDTVHYINYIGIGLSGAVNCRIYNNKISKIFYYGIYLSDSTNNLINNNNISSKVSINFANSSFNNIVNNDLDRIDLSLSNNNILSNNNVKAMFISSSTNNTVIRNKILSLTIQYSNYMNLSNNNFVTGGVFIEGNILSHFNTHDILPNNKVNNKSLLYFKNLKGINFNAKSFGQIICVNCSNISLTNNKINNSQVGIEIAFSNNTTISNNQIFLNNYHGIYIYNSTNNTILHNGIYSNILWGVAIFESSENKIFNNSIYSNHQNGIIIDRSYITVIINNSIYSNGKDLQQRWFDGNGISIFSTSQCFIENNSIYYNYRDGAFIYSSTDLKFIDNNIYSNLEGGITTSGDYYYKPFNIHLLRNNIYDNFNGILLIRAKNHNVIGNNLFLNRISGINLSTSRDNNISNNNIFWNKNHGVALVGLSSNNILNYNNISKNEYGIFIHNNSIINKIYHNNIVDNRNQSYDNTGFTYWNNTYPSGGNYWGDYTGVDNKKGPNQDQSGSDGIGDTPYNKINGSSGAKDYYPLMKPVYIENITPMVPLAPQDLRAEVGDSYVNLSWEAPIFNGFSPVTNYIIYRGNTSSKTILYKLIGNILFYNDTNVTNNITYYYRISAKNGVGEGPLSIEIRATPYNITFNIPSKPRNLQAFSGDSYVQLTWSLPTFNGNSTITNYLIYRATSPGKKIFYTQIGAKLNFNDTNVMNGVTYYYKVSAKNVIGEGPLSLEVSATPKKTINQTVPSYPRNFQAATGDKYVQLNWKAPLFNGNASITNYRIYRGTTSSGKTLLIQLGNISNHNDTNVTNGITYYYEVSAKNAIGEGPRSNEIIATPNSSVGKLNQTIPSYPQNLHPKGGNKFVNLTWETPLNDGNSTILNYSIYKGITSGGQKCCGVIGNKLFFNDTNVTNDITYYYRVSAINAIGEGPLSIEVKAKPTKPSEIIKKTEPSHPRALQATPADYYINLYWTKPSDDGKSSITNYKIYKGITSGILAFYKLIGNVLNFNDTNVIGGSTYYYRVSAINKIGEGALSNEVFATPTGSILTDTDLDNIPDYWERQYGLNILDSEDAQLDSDNDNLTNLEEFLNHTSPWNQDSDYDNLTDFEEIKIYGTDPTNPDTDGDGYNDDVEIANKTNPLDENDYPKIKETEDDEPNRADDVLMYISIIILLITIIFLLSLFIIKTRDFKNRPKD